MNKFLKSLYLLLLLALPLLTVSAAEEDREFKTINASNGLADNSAQCIECTKTGRMIIATIGDVNFYDGTEFNHIDTKLEYRYNLPAYQGNDLLCFDRYHHMWLKRTHEVTCVDMYREVFVKSPDAIFRELGCEGMVLDFFTDEEGEPWFLTDRGLICPSRKKEYQPLRDHNLQEIDVFENMLITIYDNGELIVFDLATDKVMQHNRPYDWDDAQRYLRTTQKLRYDDGYYFIKKGENESVLLQFNLRTKEWKTLLETPYAMNGMAMNGDQLYVATDHGYWVYHVKTGEKTHVEDIRLVGGRLLKTDCQTIVFDKQGGLWLGTKNRGVLYSSPSTSPFIIYDAEANQAKQYIEMMDGLKQNIHEFNGMHANCLYMDSRGWSWIGTTSGLYLYRSPKDEPEVFSTENGLLNDVIHAVVEDNNKNMWVSTSYGISFIMLDQDKVVFVNNFNQADNVPNEMFMNCKAMRLDNGHIVMQGIDHVIEFEPARFRLVNNRLSGKMYPKMIKLTVNGNNVEPMQELDGNVVIDKAITRVRDIYLNADQNTIALTFSGLNYFRPLQTYYRVRVKGLDNDWHVYSYFNGTGLVDDKGQLRLPLVGLKPGEYQVEVQSSMYPDIWEDEEPYRWIIYVNQPWWQRSGVYGVIITLILILLAVNFLFYNKNTRMRVRRNAEEGDMIRKIKSFIDRCDAFDSEILQPDEEELYGSRLEKDNSKLSPQFVELMIKIIPFVHSQKGNVTMRQLSEAGNIDIVDFYDIMTTNLYKNPNELIKTFRIEKAAGLLMTTQLTIEEIAAQCGFYTPNYFLGSFFHRYKMTPREYREEHQKS